MVRQGRGSASQAVSIAVVTLLLVPLFHSELVDAAIYQVGDAGGWSFNTVGWPKGKRFRAGDVLVFKYNPSLHNVVAVDRNSYQTCKTPRGAKVFNTGNDQIKLVKGPNSFICNFASHCEGGTKITVTAA